MTRGISRLAVASIATLILGAVVPGQVAQGVIFSEIAYGPSLPPVGGVQMPSYIELVNVRIANPTTPPPIQIGSLATGNALISASVGGNPPISFPIPFLTIPTPPFMVPMLLGGNVQPSPATPPVPPPSQPAVMLISSGPFPAGVVPSNVFVVQASNLFSGPNAQLGAPGVPFELCFQNPATGLSDHIRLGPLPATGCAGIPFTNTNTFVPTTGRAIRWCYMDSNTDIDFDPTFPFSPGIVNQEMVHVNGFFFGTSASPVLGGVPLTTPGTTSGSMFFPTGARVKSVNFANRPGASFVFNKSITNQVFDPIINAPAFLSANFLAQPPAAGSPPNFLPGLIIMNELMQINANAGAGMLFMPMNFSTQVGVNVGPSAAPGEVRPERIFTDMVTDSGATTSGMPTAAQIDVTPGSAGDGNTWCEVIVYDYNGNQYRAKVKNWPPGGICTGGPQLALGADGLGSCTVIDLCFSPNAMVANVFSTSPSAGCAVPLLPSGGICPDAITTWILTPPQFGSAPFFATTDSTGLYLHHTPSPVLMNLIGTTFYGIAVEYTPTGMVVQQSPVNSVTI